jgi:predicted ribosome quality control (RQC) complex YloA/Tae2 family protein
MAKFREHILSSGKVVLGGKSAETNEELVKQAGNNEFVLHTKKPGSPFVNIKADCKEVNADELMQAAIFCARYSQDWRDNKKDVVVHYFLGNNISKNSGMELGTFGVKKCKEIKVLKKDIEGFNLKTSESN